MLAAVALAVALRDRRDIAVAQAGLDRGEGGTHGAVLHGGGALDQFLFLGALDHLDAVDHVGGVDEFAVGETALLHVVDHGKRHLIGADQADGAARIGLERFGGELRIVGRGVVAR